MDVKKIIRKTGETALICAQKYGGVLASSIVGGAVAGAAIGPIAEGEDPQQYACKLAGHAAVYSTVVYCAGSTTLNFLKERKLFKEIEKLETELEAAASEEGGGSK